MSRIDDELEQAVSDAGGDRDDDVPEGNIPQGNAGSGSTSQSAAGRAAAGDDARPVVADSEPTQRSWGLLAGLCALGAGILVLVFNSTDEAVVYAYGVKDLNAKAAELGERQVRVIGDLVSGTLTRRDDPCEYRFNLSHTGEGEKAGETLEVHYAQCVVPDQFRDVKGVQVEVTAEGRLSSDGHLEASKIFAKCPSKYEMKEAEQAMGAAPDHGGGAPKPEFIAPRAEGIR